MVGGPSYRGRADIEKNPTKPGIPPDGGVRALTAEESPGGPTGGFTVAAPPWKPQNQQGAGTARLVVAALPMGARLQLQLPGPSDALSVRWPWRMRTIRDSLPERDRRGTLRRSPGRSTSNSRLSGVTARPWPRPCTWSSSETPPSSAPGIRQGSQSVFATPRLSRLHLRPYGAARSDPLSGPRHASSTAWGRITPPGCCPRSIRFSTDGSSPGFTVSGAGPRFSTALTGPPRRRRGHRCQVTVMVSVDADFFRPTTSVLVPLP